MDTKPKRDWNPNPAWRGTLFVAFICWWWAAAACDKAEAPRAEVVEPAAVRAAQTAAPRPGNTEGAPDAPEAQGAAARPSVTPNQASSADTPETEEETKPRPRPAWVDRYGNDPHERFPTVSKGGRAYSDESRIRQNGHLISFWRAHEAGERSVVHVKYIKGAHGILFYWRLVTEDGQARLVVLGRRSKITPDAPFGGGRLYWRLSDETPVTKLQFGSLSWEDEEARFTSLGPPYEADGPSLGFHFEPADGTDRRYFPPILRSIKSR